MWIKRNTLERRLADAMGFEYCTLFDMARRALREIFIEGPLDIPSNVCPALGALFPKARRTPIDIETGLAPETAVQLYGYRQEIKGNLDLDPLMTGFLRKPSSDNSIISFGPKKMLDAGGGGALLSNEKFTGNAYFPESLRGEIEHKLADLSSHIRRQRDRIDIWDRYLGDSCVRVPQEQVMPWRVMRRIPEQPTHLGRYPFSTRNRVVQALRDANHPVGTNYPPLPGVTDRGAIQWGKEVINFFPDWIDIPGTCEIIKRTIAA
jgi:hypothetical protein